MPADATIYIVDDDSDVRDSLKLLLESLSFRVETFGSAQAFLARPVAPNACLVTDIRMPDMDGLELQEEIARRKIPIAVIVMTGHGDVPLAVRAMKAGATDFLEKPFEEEALVRSIRRALETQVRSYAQLVAAQEARERVASLTEREREVFELVAAGKPNKAIAYDLDISQRTVEIHRAHVMDKLDARNLAELVRIWLTLQHESP